MGFVKVWIFMRNDGVLLGLGAEFVVLLIGGAFFSFPFVFLKLFG